MGLLQRAGRAIAGLIEDCRLAQAAAATLCLVSTNDSRLPNRRLLCRLAWPWEPPSPLGLGWWPNDLGTSVTGLGLVRW